MTENIAAATALQTFAPGVMFELQGKKFTVEKLGEPEKLRPHLLTGARGASYWMHGYITAGRESTPERYYVVSVRGSGEPLRGKNGRRLEAYIFGDLISTAN